jgi:hypothetical protein
MRTPIASLLVLAIATLPLAGCGRASAPSAAGVRTMVKTKARSADAPLSATGLAARFADLVKPTFTGSLFVLGPIVTLTTDGIATRYDFARSPETGTVVVSSGEFTTELPLDELMPATSGKPAGSMQAEVLPVLLVPIATQCAIAAAKALAMYAITHRGEEFDKSDALKACVVAMGLSLIPFVGPFGTAGALVPVAAKILASSTSFAFADIAKAAVGLLDEIVPIVLMLIKSRKAAES